MIKFFLASVLTLIVPTSDSFAFSWSGCTKVVCGSHPCKGEFQTMFSTTTGYPTSSAQLTSSWGKCSLFGSNYANRPKIFIAKNLSNLMHDSSLGAGEYINTYAHLIGCDDKGRKAFYSSTKKNYTQIFGNKLELSPKQVHENIETFINNNPEIANNCLKVSRT